MKILVTGSRGFIGASLLASSPWATSAITIIESDLKIARPIEIYKSYGQHEIDTLIHLAASTSVPGGEMDKSYYIHNNVVCMKKLLESVKARCVIFMSTDAVYDTEYKSDHSDINPKTVYGATKLIGESLVKEYTDQYYILRLANPLGRIHPNAAPGSTFNIGEAAVIPKLAIAAIQNKEFPIHDDHNMIRDFIELDFVTKIVWELAISRKARYGTYDLGSGSPTFVTPILKRLCQDFNINYSLVPRPSEVAVGAIRDQLLVKNIFEKPRLEAPSYEKFKAITSSTIELFKRHYF